MKCQNLFSRKNKKNIPICRLLKILLRVLSVNLEVLFIETVWIFFFFLFLHTNMWVHIIGLPW